MTAIPEPPGPDATEPEIVAWLAAAGGHDRPPLGPDATEADLMARLAEDGALQVQTQRLLDIYDARVKPLLLPAYELEHWPTELSRLTRWSRFRIRTIVDPGADQVGRAAHDPNRTPKPLGRKARKAAAGHPRVTGA